MVVYMAIITFKGKLWNIGQSTVVTIPNQYIKDGHLWIGEDFTISVDNNEPAGTLQTKTAIEILTRGEKK